MKEKDAWLAQVSGIHTQDGLFSVLTLNGVKNKENALLNLVTYLSYNEYYISAPGNRLA